MNTKFFRVLMQILQIAVFLVLCTICYRGFVCAQTLTLKAPFIETAVRGLVCVVFLIFYYRTFSSEMGNDGVFLPLFLLSTMLMEIRILENYTQVSGLVLLNPILGVSILLFSSIMAILSLAGYGLFYVNNESTNVSRYVFFSIGAGALTVACLPKLALYSEVWNIPVIRILYSILFISCTLIFVILLFTDTPGVFLIRHFAAIFLVAGVVLNLYFNTFLMNLIATAVYFVGLIIIMFVSIVGDVKL